MSAWMKDRNSLLNCQLKLELEVDDLFGIVKKSSLTALLLCLNVDVELCYVAIICNLANFLLKISYPAAECNNMHNNICLISANQPRHVSSLSLFMIHHNIFQCFSYYYKSEINQWRNSNILFISYYMLYGI